MVHQVPKQVGKETLQWQQLAKILLGAGAILISLTFGSSVMAAPCGDGIGPGGSDVPCSCGDTVVADRTLARRKTLDPVARNVCSGTALTITADGITLDFGGAKIRGSGTGDGILIQANDVKIEGPGTVLGFQNGITGTTNMTWIDGVDPDSSGNDGIALHGHLNKISHVKSQHNHRYGVAVFGNENELIAQNNEYNGGDGLRVEGAQNKVLFSKASENNRPGNGITVIGNQNYLEGNSLSKLNTHGIFVDGDDNTLIGNFAAKQREYGILVEGDRNKLTDNRSAKSDGILVTGNRGGVNSSGNIASPGDCIIYEADNVPAICDRR